MAKPSTNSEAIQYWADSILAASDAPALDVNSIEINDGAIFHYGRHWPMGVIERRENGTVKRVFINSNLCVKTAGFGPATNSVNWDVRAAARAVARQRQPNIPVIEVPMGSMYRASDRIMCRPKSSDPKPPSDWRCEIPTYFYATDPGPEPVDDGIGCIAGQREEYSYAETVYIWDWQSSGPRPGDWWLASDKYERWANGVLVWESAPSWWQHQYETGVYARNALSSEEEYKQCPHCKVFREKHAAWKLRMDGPTHGAKRGKGWVLYSEMMGRYGSAEEWKSERLAEFRRVRDGRQAHADWVARNSMPQDHVPRLGNGSLHYVPRLDKDGYPFRKDEEKYRLFVRHMERQKKRWAREAAARERHHRQVERFARRMRARRGTSFAQRAANVARELAAVNAALSTTTEELES